MRMPLAVLALLPLLSAGAQAAAVTVPRPRPMLPVRPPVCAASLEDPQAIAECLVPTVKFLKESKAYDSAMKRIPQDQLEAKDRENMEFNAQWHLEDSEKALAMLRQLNAWAENSRTSVGTWRDAVPARASGSAQEGARRAEAASQARQGAEPAQKGMQQGVERATKGIPEELKGHEHE